MDRRRQTDEREDGKSHRAPHRADDLCNEDRHFIECIQALLMFFIWISYHSLIILHFSTFHIDFISGKSDNCHMNIQYEEAPVAKFIFGNTKMSLLWLIVRVYVGWSWLEAGWGKFTGTGWVGADAGKSLSGFIQGALSKTAGAHPDVQWWYGTFLQNIILSHASFWSHVITYGEILVGIALIIGLFTGIAAFFGLFMNLNFMLAGSVSVNPILFTLSIFLILAWKVAGYIGIDRFALPALGTYWQPGKLFKS